MNPKVAAFLRDAAYALVTAILAAFGPYAGKPGILAMSGSDLKTAGNVAIATLLGIVAVKGGTPWTTAWGWFSTPTAPAAPAPVPAPVPQTVGAVGTVGTVTAATSPAATVVTAVDVPAASVLHTVVNPVTGQVTAAL